MLDAKKQGMGDGRLGEAGMQGVLVLGKEESRIVSKS